MYKLLSYRKWFINFSSFFSQNSTGSLVVHPGWLDGFDHRSLTDIWKQTKKAWHSLLQELLNESEPERNLVVVGHPALHIALIAQCLNLTMEWMGSFHLDAGSVSVIDFPDGPTGRGIVRCINYTAHLGRWSIPVTRSTAYDEEF